MEKKISAVFLKRSVALGAFIALVVLGIFLVLIVSRANRNRTRRDGNTRVLEERTRVAAEWIVFREPKKHGRPTRMLSVDGLNVTEFDSNGDGKVDKIVLSIKGVAPFVKITDSKFSGKFDTIWALPNDQYSGKEGKGSESTKSGAEIADEIIASFEKSK